jgi:hypothetical protein
MYFYRHNPCRRHVFDIGKATGHRYENLKGHLKSSVTGLLVRSQVVQ